LKNIYFLKWWLVFSLFTIGLIFATSLGFTKEIYNKDLSYISVCTLALFYCQSVCCGKLFYNLSNDMSKKKLTKEKFSTYNRKAENGWFISEMCLNLGMLGTIIGFVMMLSGFESLDISNPSTISTLLSNLGKSMATALYTTLVGIICGCLLKIQYYILDIQFKAIEDEGLINEKIS
jgi:nitrate/nitrite transporter NarK